MLMLSGGAVPWDELRKWSEVRRLAAVVAIGELNGRSYDWERQIWREAA